MTNQEHLITPPDELVQQWVKQWQQTSYKPNDLYIHITTAAARWGADQQLKLDAEQIAQAYQAGADQELEACVNLLGENRNGELALALKNTRRPKPPSLKEQALAELEKVDMLWDTSEFGADTLSALDTIRRALESLLND